MLSIPTFLALAAAVPTLVVAQLSGTVGPLTTSAKKAATKTCDITKYGAVADGKTDISTALNSAFAACKTGGVVVIPSGDYALENWVTLSGGSAWALQLDGIIYRTGTDLGNMIMIEHTTDFELFSSTSKGAIQGNGYVFHKEGTTSGPRLLRLYEATDFSVHDIALVDSPMFHFTVDTCDGGEIYNMAIRGGNEGGLDGIDIFSTNIHVHDVMVTNKDECVTVKSPSKNLLIENVYCNWSGGCAMGSLGADTAISAITYRNIYTWSSNQMMMIKSNGGSGTVSDIVFENFIGHGNAYSLDIDQYWESMKAISGSGVELSNIKINNWTGTESSGVERGPIKVICASGAPCYDLEITDFAMWTESGSSQGYSCENAYGSGFCLKSGSDHAAYDVTTSTVNAAPTGYIAPTMAEDLKTAFGTAASIPIPTLPASFFPGIAPLSAFAGNSVASAAKVVATSAASSSKTTLVASVSKTSAAVHSSKTSTSAKTTASVKTSAMVSSSETSAASSAEKSSTTSMLASMSASIPVPVNSASASAASSMTSISANSTTSALETAPAAYLTTSSTPVATVSSSFVTSVAPSSSLAAASSAGSSSDSGSSSGSDSSDEGNCAVVYVYE